MGVFVESFQFGYSRAGAQIVKFPITGSPSRRKRRKSRPSLRGLVRPTSRTEISLNSTREMLSQFDQKFLRKLLEASWIRVQLISPIGDLKHILGRNKNEIVRWIRFKRDKEVLKVNKRLMDNRGALRQIVAAEIERWF